MRVALREGSVRSRGHEGDRWQRSTDTSRHILDPLGSTAAVQVDGSLRERGFEYQRREIRPNKRALRHSLSRGARLLFAAKPDDLERSFYKRARPTFIEDEKRREFFLASRARYVTFHRKIDRRTTLSRIWWQTSVSLRTTNDFEQN